MNKYAYIYNKNYINLLYNKYALNDHYLSSNSSYPKYTEIFHSPLTSQSVSSPFYDYDFNSQNYFIYENCPYIITAGNDMTIRYRDLTKDGIKNINK